MSKIENQNENRENASVFHSSKFLFFVGKFVILLMKTIPTEMDLIDKENIGRKPKTLSLSNPKFKHF